MLDAAAVLSCEWRGPFCGRYEEWRLQGMITTYHISCHSNCVGYWSSVWPSTCCFRPWKRSWSWINVPLLSWLNSTIWRRFPTRCVWKEKGWQHSLQVDRGVLIRPHLWSAFSILTLHLGKSVHWQMLSSYSLKEWLFAPIYGTLFLKTCWHQRPSVNKKETVCSMIHNLKQGHIGL